MYRLYLGFRLLGKFDSILEAKLFAGTSGLSGVFNLIGDNYRDAWYIFENEKVKREQQIGRIEIFSPFFGKSEWKINK